MTWRGNRKGRSQVMLLNFTYNPDTREEKAVYRVSHSSQIWRTTLEQDLTLTRTEAGRLEASIDLDGLAVGMTDREAMLKLADWLHRLGVAIEDNWSEP